jgi:phosphohistidine phosphatase SixA
MQADFQKLKRRPFFLPLLMPVALLALLIATAIWLLDARGSTVFVLVRHAEVEQSLAANPGLNELGKTRANGLLQLLAQAKPGRAVDAVYAIESLPAQQTAAPLAAKMGIAVNVIPAAEWNAQLSSIRDNHVGETVLVVASREQLQKLLHNINTQEWLIDEPDYGSVFVLSESRLSKSSVIRLRY